MTGTARRRQDYTGVAVAVPVTVPYVKYSIRSAHWFVARALAALLDKAGIEKTQIDGACISSFTLFPDTAVGLMQHLGLVPRWLDHIPMGGACGIVALRRALRAVQTGDAEIVACIAADTNHIDTFRQTVASFSQFARDAVNPYGSGGPNASFAFLTEHYMRTTGALREDFGKLCVAQRSNAQHNPLALLRKPLTLDEYLSARPIAEPLRLYDCVMPCAGAEAFLVMTSERARQLALPFAVCLRAGHDRAAQRVSGGPDPGASRLGARSRRSLCTGRRRPSRHGFRRVLRRLPRDHRHAVRGPWLLREGRGAAAHPRQHVHR
jgi:acetyl-CoA acetyltransferase